MRKGKKKNYHDYREDVTQCILLHKVGRKTRIQQRSGTKCRYLRSAAFLPPGARCPGAARLQASAQRCSCVTTARGPNPWSSCSLKREPGVRIPLPSTFWAVTVVWLPRHLIPGFSFQPPGLWGFCKCRSLPETSLEPGWSFDAVPVREVEEVQVSPVSLGDQGHAGDAAHVTRREGPVWAASDHVSQLLRCVRNSSGFVQAVVGVCWVTHTFSLVSE